MFPINKTIYEFVKTILLKIRRMYCIISPRPIWSIHYPFSWPQNGKWCISTLQCKFVIPKLGEKLKAKFHRCDAEFWIRYWCSSAKTRLGDYTTLIPPKYLWRLVIQEDLNRSILCQLHYRASKPNDEHKQGYYIVYSVIKTLFTKRDLIQGNRHGDPKPTVMLDLQNSRVRFANPIGRKDLKRKKPEQQNELHEWPLRSRLTSIFSILRTI